MFEQHIIEFQGFPINPPYLLIPFCSTYVHDVHVVRYRVDLGVMCTTGTSKNISPGRKGQQVLEGQPAAQIKVPINYDIEAAKDLLDA